MSAFIDLWNELTQQVRSLDGLLAQKFVNRAWIDIGDSYEWSWLRAQGALSAPAAISTGAVSINQFSRTLTFDAAATTVLDSISADIPLTTRSIKIASSPPYQIASYTPGGTATLDPLGPAFQEASVTLGSFSIVRAFYDVPSDFLRFISVYDPVSDYPLHHGPKLTQQLLDRLDPQRTTSSQPAGLYTAYTKRIQASTGETTSYSPRFEMWPHPTVARGYPFTYRRRTPEFVNDDDTLPGTIEAELVLWRAKFLAYEWAETNKANQPLLQGPNWFNLAVLASKEYGDGLRAAQKFDRETFPNVIVQKRTYGVGPDYYQSHDDPRDIIDAIGGYYR